MKRSLKKIAVFFFRGGGYRRTNTFGNNVFWMARLVNPKLSLRMDSGSPNANGSSNRLRLTPTAFSDGNG